MDEERWIPRPVEPASTRAVTVLFVAAMGGLGGPVKRLVTLLANLPRVRRVLIKPRSALLDERISERGSIDEHISVSRSAQRSYVGSVLLMFRIFTRALSRRDPVDVIHANGIVEFALSWPTALVLRKPVVTWVGNYEAPVLVKRFRRVFRSVSNRTAWNAVSTTSADVIADCGLATREDVRIVTNIIDPADVATSEHTLVSREDDRLVIGYLQVGKWVKGFDLLPKVIEQLSDLHEQVKFVIYGKPSNSGVWVELASVPTDVLEIRPRTANVAEIYAYCDIVFSPSRRESFNRIVAEAMATGTPVVASDLVPVRDVLGGAGLLFPVDDVSAAAGCLRRLVGDAELRAQLAIAGRYRSKAWLPGPIAAEFLRQYQELANACSPRPGHPTSESPSL